MRTDRIGKIVESMERHGMDQMIISDPSTIFYLTGRFVAPGFRLLVLYLDTQGECTFFLNALQSDYADLHHDICWYQDSEDPIQRLAEKIQEGATVGIDKNWSANFLLRLMQARPAHYVLTGEIIDRIRMIKDEGEIQAMRETCAVNQKVMARMFPLLRAGMTETEHRKALHELYCSYGAEGYNITPIVAYGQSCGFAHHKSDGTVLKSGDCVLIDTGARYHGYRSDMTRTVFYQSVSEEMRNIYQIVLEAQTTAMAAVKPGMRFCDIDRIGREIIAKHGYGEYFTHRIGHNIGIDGHEFPDVGGANEMEIQPGMCFSVEPGIYIPGKGGVRIEDLLVVTPSGHECFYDYTKELQIVG